MKLFLVLALVSLALAAWSPQDREIFALNAAVQNDLGDGVSFYDWLEVKRSASSTQIGKAYRRLSQQLHPDKNPSPGAAERFARLGLVNKVLRSEARERYDFFLTKGFPQLRGSDYYYSRYRPGLVTVLVFLATLVTVAQYGFLWLTARQHRIHMAGIIADVKEAAGVVTTQRKVAHNSRSFMVYPSGEVFLLADGEEHLLDPSSIVQPTWRDTLVWTIPQWAYRKVKGHVEGDVKADGKGETKESDKPEKAELKPRPANKVGNMRLRR